MRTKKITSFRGFLDEIEDNELLGYSICLYRGQPDKSTLLPTVARVNPKFDSTKTEIKMLDEFKRHSSLLIKKEFKSDWEWLVYAQHFGLKTRLLDWTSNPLIALWFACSNEYKFDVNSYVYILRADDDMLVDLIKNESPFENTLTRIMRPSLNNERIVAQAGWFTAHKYTLTAKKFVSLEYNKIISPLLTQLEIPASLKHELLDKLSIFGINSRSIFPDVSGLCSYLNWEYQGRISKKQT